MPSSPTFPAPTSPHKQPFRVRSKQQQGGASQGTDDFLKNTFSSSGIPGVGDIGEYMKTMGFAPSYSRFHGQGFKSGRNFVSMSEAIKRARGDAFARSGGLGSQLLATNIFDTTRAQQAADQQHEDVRGAADDFLQSGLSGAQEARDLADEQYGTLNELAGGIESRGEEGYERFESEAAAARGRIQGYLRSGIGDARDALEGYEDQTLAQAQFAQQGVAERYSQEMKRMFEPNADGTMPTDAQMNERRRGARRDAALTGAQINTQIMTRFNETKAALGFQLGQMQIQAGGITAGFETAISGQRVGAEANRQRSSEFGATLRVQSEQFRTAASNYATQLEVNSRGMYAEMIRNSPQEVISLLPGLASILGILTAPGAGALGPLQLPKNSIGAKSLEGLFA